MRDYAQASAAEWPMLARRESSAQVPPQADRLLKLMASQALAQATAANVQTLMLGKVSEIRAQRDLRIGLSQTHVNPLKWLGMAFLGLSRCCRWRWCMSTGPRGTGRDAVVLSAAAPTAAIVRWCRAIRSSSWRRYPRRRSWPPCRGCERRRRRYLVCSAPPTGVLVCAERLDSRPSRQLA